MILLVTGYQYKFRERTASFFIVRWSAGSVFQQRYHRNRLLSLRADNVIHYRTSTRYMI